MMHCPCYFCRLKCSSFFISITFIIFTTYFSPTMKIANAVLLLASLSSSNAAVSVMFLLVVAVVASAAGDVDDVAVWWWWLFETTPLLLPPGPTGGLGSCHPPHRSAWWRPRRVELLSRRAFAFPLPTLHPSPGGRGLWPTLYAATTARWGEMMIRLCVLSTQVTIYTYFQLSLPSLSPLSLSLSLSLNPADILPPCHGLNQ